MFQIRRFKIGDMDVTTMTLPATEARIPLSELQAMRATMAELLALTDALQPISGPGHVRAVQGLARSLASRLGRWA